MSMPGARTSRSHIVQSMLGFVIRSRIFSRCALSADLDVRAPSDTGPGQENKSWTPRDRTIRISRPANLKLRMVKSCHSESFLH